MATTQILRLYSAVAGADLTSSQFRFVSINAAGLAVLTAAGALPDGVLQNNPNTGEEASIAELRGIAKVRAVGTIAGAGNVAVGASGQAGAAATGNAIAGKAIEPAVAGQLVEVLLGFRGTAA